MMFLKIAVPLAYKKANDDNDGNRVAGRPQLEDGGMTSTAFNQN